MLLTSSASFFGASPPVSSQWFISSSGALRLPRSTAQEPGSASSSTDGNPYGVSWRSWS